MAWELLAQTAPIVNKAHHILEVGCGTGYLTAALRRLNPHANLLALDLDAALLARARRRLPPDPHLAWVVADGELPPSRDVNLIISNSTFQWFTHPETTISLYFQSLKKCGCLAFSTLGPGTFGELAAALRQAGNLLNINRIPSIPASAFLTATDWARILQQAGFPAIHLQRLPLSLAFPTVPDFLQSLQATGATNPQPRPFSAKLYKTMVAAYQDLFRQNGAITVTYEVILAVAGK